jgi:DNA mismatch repair protein MSH2
MRSVALCAYMTQIGCFVPCTSANICPVDSILVRLGASDSQYDGVSTFMAEMLDASRILRQATARSLVIIDELGRGTSTFDGLSLGRTIAKELAKNVGAFTLFATHFFEVTQLSSQVECVGNLFCDAIATPTKFTLLYEVKPGVSKKSFGINVASLAGFPPSVVEAAEEAMLEDDGVIDSVGQMDADYKVFQKFVEDYRKRAADEEGPQIRKEARAHFAKITKIQSN